MNAMNASMNAKKKDRGLNLYANVAEVHFATLEVCYSGCMHTNLIKCLSN